MSDPIQGELSVPDDRRAMTTTPTSNVEHISNMLAAALDKGISPESLEKLVMLQERVMAKQAEAEFNAALLDFQSECPIIGKSREVDTGKYRYTYAELSHIVHTVRPLLRAYGLSFSFDSNMIDGRVEVKCIVSHIAGHSKVTNFAAPVDTNARMNDTQKVASAITYARRYALVLALGLTVGDDDDGRYAMPDEKPNPARNDKAPRAATRGQRAQPVTYEQVRALIDEWKRVIATEADANNPAAFGEWVAFICKREFQVLARRTDTNAMSHWTQEDLAQCQAAIKEA